MKTKFTPGPWIILKSANPDTVGRWTIFPDDSGGRARSPYYWGIAEVPLGPDRPEQAANARLIAAAPELLEELKYAVHLLKAHSLPKGVREKFEVAIAKAEGGTPEDK